MSLILSGTDGLSDVDGTAATPAIRGTDANTGIFFPAADTIAFSEGGVEAARFDSAGNLLLGTTTPVFNAAGRGLITINGSSAAALGFTAGAVDKGIILHTGTDMIMSNSVSGAITFQTNNTERMRIDSSGNLLVGATSGAASEKLGVYQTTANVGLFVSVAVASSTANPAISSRKFDNNNTTSQIYHTFAFNNGASGAGGIQGNGASGIQFFSSSDARLKENIVELEPQLANIMALKPSKFDFIDGPKDCTGFIAQEMETVYSDAIGETPDGFKTIGGISIMETRLIKCIQEQQALITSLTTRITALETPAPATPSTGTQV